MNIVPFNHFQNQLLAEFKIARQLWIKTLISGALSFFKSKTSFGKVDSFENENAGYFKTSIAVQLINWNIFWMLFVD